MTISASDLGSAGVSHPALQAPLTKRELDVLELIAFGLTNKEIAERLSLGRRTVETHVDHVLAKLGAPTRTRAVAEAGRLGLLGAAQAPNAAADVAPNNLPFALTTLLGRERDIADIKSLLEKHRLLTLSGAGGVGKTRLALRVAFDLLGTFEGGVWFCDLSPVSDSASAAPRAVAKAIGIREQPGRTVADAIVQTLRRKNTLLVLDNCEHVLDAAAELAEKMLNGCSGVHILATSRQRLGITGEAVHRVRSLDVPQAGRSISVAEALQFGAVALFADRAQAADDSFALGEDNVEPVAEICRRLDGIPLAIELAATRMHVVDVHSVALSLDDRFAVLTAGSRTALPRQKTLKALIDWSYDLLSAQERTLFSRLGVFGSDFDLQAAMSVCSGDGLRSAEVPVMLSGLVDKSLVTLHPGRKQQRYALLESTRAYALDKLARGHERERYARLHAEHFRARVRAADESYGVGSPFVWMARVEQDLENYRAALRWSISDGNDVALGGDIAGSLERLWFLAGVAVEARRWIGAALDRIDEAEYPAIAARLWRAKARFLQGQPMHDSAQRALTLYESIGDVRGAAYSLRYLAYSLLQMGDLDGAAGVIERAIEAFRSQGDSVGLASCLGLQGVSAYNRHDFASGRTFYVQAIAAFKALGDDFAAADVLGNLGELEFADGKPDQALGAVTASLKITAAGKDMANLAIDYNNRAAYLIALGKIEEARESACDGLRWARPEENAWNIAVALQHLALVAAQRGAPERSARILGYVNARYADLALEREATEQWAHERLMVTLRAALTENDIERLALEGTTWSEDEAVEEATRA